MFGSTFVLSHEMAVYKYTIFTRTKRSEKERASLFDDDFRIVNAAGVGFLEAKRKMSEWIQNLIKRNLTIRREDLRFAS